MLVCHPHCGSAVVQRKGDVGSPMENSVSRQDVQGSVGGLVLSH